MRRPQVFMREAAIIRNIFTGTHFMTGYVENHPHLKDRTRRIFTSEVLSIDLKKKKVKTLNTIYNILDWNPEILLMSSVYVNDETGELKDRHNREAIKIGDRLWK